ncbi:MULTISPECIES: hypothetical protein [unclassified Pseudomonas]|nr:MULTISPECIES: hypothetical protein [unclassified Pseudomonas]
MLQLVFLYFAAASLLQIRNTGRGRLAQCRDSRYFLGDTLPQQA